MNTSNTKMEASSSSLSVGKGVLILFALGSLLGLGLLYWIVLSGRPLGLPGEWVWNRSPAPPTSPTAWILPLITGGAYLAFVLMGDVMAGRFPRLVSWVMIPLLCGAGFGWQWAALEFTHPPYGMERWIPSLYFESTTGYFHHARSVTNSAEFAKNYKDWAAKADSFHQGTHPPGLILSFRCLLNFFEQNPRYGEGLERWVPARLRDGFELIPLTLVPSERATLLAAPLLAWGMSLSTVVGLYALLRTSFSPRASWWGAALWPTLPCSLVFLPLADAVYPAIAVLCWLLAVWSFRNRIGLLAIGSGMILCGGLVLSLAFLVVGAILGLWIVLESIWERAPVRGLMTLVCVAAGVALPIEAALEWYKVPLLDIALINLSKHAGFYEAMPRSTWPWIGINLLELAAMTSPILLLLASACAIGTLMGARSSPFDRLTAAWWIVVILLDLSGRNRSEAARLWIFLMPIAAGAGSWAFGEKPGRLPLLGRVGLTFSTIIGTLILLSWVEPLLPVVLSP